MVDIPVTILKELGLTELSQQIGEYLSDAHVW